MKVARHEIPGMRPDRTRPVGNGTIRNARPCSCREKLERPCRPDQTVPYGMGFSMRRFQAFHARHHHLVPMGQYPCVLILIRTGGCRICK
jgi:hypothetical protein